MLWAKGVYMTAEQFLASSFPDTPPKSAKLWLTPDVKKQASQILSRPYRSLRVRYWSQQQRSAWIFDEIGKELPITIGVIVNGKGIESVRILAFRESRGGEVRYPFFTNQFEGIKLDDKLRLNSHIDGISGATLSVRAVKRVSRLALYFHQQAITESDVTTP